MNVLIIGCGKTGARLATQLDEYGYDVAIVDADEQAFQSLGERFSGLPVCGIVTDMDVLRNAGADNADLAVVVTENDTEIEPNGDGSYGPAVDQAVYAITVSFTYDPPRAEIDVDANKGTVSRSDISGFFNDSYSYYGIAKEANDIEYLYNLLGYEYPFSVKDGEYFI